MNISWAEALQGVELQGGRTYRCQVQGWWVELRVLGPAAGPAPLTLSEADVMLEPWTELPKPPPTAFLSSQLGEPRAPEVPDLPPEKTAPRSSNALNPMNHST